MAKVIGPLHSSEARGSVSSLTYNSWRGISTVKARSGPSTQYSAAQVALRALTALATAAWQAMSDVERAAWYIYANAHPDIDWSGNPQRITAYNWYIRINVRRQIIGGGIEDIPPSDQVVLTIKDLDMNAHGGQTYIVWDGQSPFLSNEPLVEAWGVGPHSAGASPSIKMASRIGFTEEWFASIIWPGNPTGTLTAFARIMMLSGVVGPWQSIRKSVP